MVVRWVSAAIVETQKKFRRVQGWQEIEKLIRVLAPLELTQEVTCRARHLRLLTEPPLGEDQPRTGQPLGTNAPFISRTTDLSEFRGTFGLTVSPW